MNKKIISAFTAVLLITSLAVNSAHGDTTPQPTLAILDTAVNSSLPEFAGKIVYEVCITEWSGCSNGKSFMEGPGSAGMPLDQMSSRDFNHGTQMASAAIKNNPNIQIVFVRIIGATPKGSRQLAGTRTVIDALDWVAKNKERFNIQAVSLSQTHHNLTKGITTPNGTINYCPMGNKVQSKIQSLKAINIPVFVAAGNMYDRSRISWPACIPESIAIGAVDKQNEIASYSNNDYALLDFYDKGIEEVSMPSGVRAYAAGTSTANAIAAGRWVTLKMIKPSLSYDEAYAIFSKTSNNVKNAYITSGKLINMGAAING